QSIAKKQSKLLSNKTIVKKENSGKIHRDNKQSMKNMCSHPPSLYQGDVPECLLDIKRFNLDKIPQYVSESSFINGMMPHSKLVSVLERQALDDDMTYQNFIQLYRYFESQDGEVVLSLPSEIKSTIKAMSKKLGKQLSVTGDYPITLSSKKMSYGVFSDLSDYYTEQDATYKAIVHRHSHIREQKEVKAGVDFVDMFTKYSFDEKVALYLYFSLLKEKGAPIPIEILALLDLNIKNERSIEVVTSNKKYVRNLERTKNDLIRLSQVRYIPSSRIHPREVNVVTRLQHMFTRTHRTHRNDALFEYVPYAQRLFIPSHVHFNVKGMCYFLSLAYSYLADVHGVEKGRAKLVDIMNNLSKISHYGNDSIHERFRAIAAFNPDSHVIYKEKALVPCDELKTEELGEFNKEGRLTVRELVDILFDEKSCGGKQHLQIIERSKLGLHACSVLREIVEDPITNEKKVCLNYFEPNYGFIKTDNKKLFMHSLMRMGKGNIGFSIHHIQPQAVAGYVNRFGNQAIDFLENRIADNPHMFASTRLTPAASSMKSIDAIIYNYYQGRQKNILPAILSLCRTWEAMEKVAEESGIAIPSIRLYNSLQSITPHVLSSIHDSMNLRQKASNEEQMIENTLFEVDLEKPSQERESLYGFLRELINQLKQGWSLELDTLSSHKETQALSLAKKALLESIKNLERMMQDKNKQTLF
ncbi:MAG: hypothetical protein K2M30_01680, partial [Desulfovibrionaceae bacterium]|nr:hypothetical protein [Desulfovibrionaceae bacterium]